MTIIQKDLHNKNSSKKKKKFRLILDSAFAKCTSFPKLIKKSNLAHCVHDFGLPPQAEDIQIYQVANKENRFVLTINFKHFRKFVKKNESGIIGIDSQLTNGEIDELVSQFVSKNDPKNFLGKSVKL